MSGPLYGFPHLGNGWCVEQPAGDAVLDDVSSPPAVEPDHRRAARLSLRHGDTEVLVDGEDQGAGGAVEVEKRLVVHRSEKGDVRGRTCAQARPQIPFSDHHQTLLEIGEGRNNEVWTLVAGQSPDVEEAVAPLAPGRENVGVHRRVDDAGTAAIEAPDPFRDRRGVRDEDVDVVGSGTVPPPEPLHRKPGGRPQQRRKASLLRVEVPGVPHRRVAVAKVGDSVPDPDGLRARVAARDHCVHTHDRVADLPGKRHQRKEPLVVLQGPGNALQERRLRTLKARRHAFPVDKRGQELYIGIGAENLVDDSLRSRVADEPVVSNGDSHSAQANLERVKHQPSARVGGGLGRPEVGLDDLSVVIVDWNLPDHTIRCVRALTSDGVPPGRIVVVENGPTDANWTRIKSDLPACTLVRIEENVGFAMANNIGAGVLPGRAYLLVNNDAFVHRPGSVKGLLRCLRGKVGIVAPRLLNEDLSLQPSVAPFMVPLTALIRASGISRFIPNRWQPWTSTHWDHASPREIQSAIGAVLLVDGEAWSDLEGFDETSFMYSEDLDLFWRAHQHGWKAWFASDACFLHLKGTSSDLRWTAGERGEQIARAEAAMIRGHLSRPRALATLTFMRLGLAARVLVFSVAGRQQLAESCRGSLRGLAVGRDGQERSRQRPAIEVVPPSGGSEQRSEANAGESRAP